MILGVPVSKTGELISTVTFPKSGSYTLELAVGNGSGFTVKKTVVVTVA